MALAPFAVYGKDSTGRDHLNLSFRENGDGSTVGAWLPSIRTSPGTASSGIDVARKVAATASAFIRNWGRGPNIMLGDSNLEKAGIYGVRFHMPNSGQTRPAPPRMLVLKSRFAEVTVIAKTVAESTTI